MAIYTAAELAEVTALGTSEAEVCHKLLLLLKKYTDLLQMVT